MRKHGALFIWCSELPANGTQNINGLLQTYDARKATPTGRRLTWHAVTGGYLFVRLA